MMRRWKQGDYLCQWMVMPNQVICMANIDLYYLCHDHQCRNQLIMQQMLPTALVKKVDEMTRRDRQPRFATALKEILHRGAQTIATAVDYRRRINSIYVLLQEEDSERRRSIMDEINQKHARSNTNRAKQREKIIAKSRPQSHISKRQEEFAERQSREHSRSQQRVLKYRKESEKFLVESRMKQCSEMHRTISQFDTAALRIHKRSNHSILKSLSAQKRNQANFQKSRKIVISKKMILNQRRKVKTQRTNRCIRRRQAIQDEESSDLMSTLVDKQLEFNKRVQAKQKQEAKAMQEKYKEQQKKQQEFEERFARVTSKPQPKCLAKHFRTIDYSRNIRTARDFSARQKDREDKVKANLELLKNKKLKLQAMQDKKAYLRNRRTAFNKFQKEAFQLIIDARNHYSIQQRDTLTTCS